MPERLEMEINCVIGEYVLTRTDGDATWILKDGEGIQISDTEVHQMIDKYYRENS